MSQRPSKGMSKNNGQHAPSNNLDSTGNNGSKYGQHTANTLREVPRGFSHAWRPFLPLDLSPHRLP